MGHCRHTLRHGQAACHPRQPERSRRSRRRWTWARPTPSSQHGKVIWPRPSSTLAGRPITSPWSAHRTASASSLGPFSAPVDFCGLCQSDCALIPPRPPFRSRVCDLQNLRQSRTTCSPLPPTCQYRLAAPLSLPLSSPLTPTSPCLFSLACHRRPKKHKKKTFSHVPSSILFLLSTTTTLPLRPTTHLHSLDPMWCLNATGLHVSASL
jgi:hypothetical protein